MQPNKSCETPANDASHDYELTKEICFLKAVSYTVTECGQEITVPAHSSEIEVAGIDGDRSIRVWDAILTVHSGGLQHHGASLAIVWSKFGGLLIYFGNICVRLQDQNREILDCTASLPNRCKQ